MVLLKHVIACHIMRTTLRFPIRALHFPPPIIVVGIKHGSLCLVVHSEECIMGNMGTYALQPPHVVLLKGTIPCVVVPAK